MRKFREEISVTSAFVDLMRKHFGDDCKLIYASENGRMVRAVSRLRKLGVLGVKRGG